MKKIITTLLVALSFNIVTAVATQDTNKPLSEGVYEPSELCVQLCDLNSIQNVSESDIAYFIVFNDNETVLQSIKLEPKSCKYELYPLSPSYRLIIIGKGSVILS